MKGIFLLFLSLILSVALAQQASAQIILFENRNIPIPTDFDGVFIDIESGSTGTSNSLSSWDVNPFFGGAGIANSPIFQPVRAGTGNLEPILNLPLGTSIGPGSTFSSGFGGSDRHLGTGPNQFEVGVPGYFGFQFTPEGTSDTLYGWMEVTLANNLPGGVVSGWAFDSTGNPIFAGSFFELGQLFNSAIPMNQAVGLLASNIHSTGTRDFAGRLHRVRTRYEDPDAVANSGDTLARRGSAIAASRFFRMEQELEIESTIGLCGRTPKAPAITSEMVDTLALAESSPFGSVEYLAGGSPGTLASGKDWIVYGSADFGNAELASLGGNPSVKSSTQGTSIGAEYLVSDSLSLGIGWSHLWNQTDLGNNVGGVDMEGDAVVAYATWFRNNLWADGMYSYGNYQTDLRRNTANGQVRAEPDISTHQTAINLGYNMKWCDVIHGPTLGATHTTGTLDAYAETGSPQAVNFAEQDFDSLITTFAWQFNWEHETCWGKVRPQLRLGYGRENLDQNQTIQAIVPQLNNLVFSQTQSDPGEGWFDFGAGLAFDFRKHWQILIDYNAQFGREDAEVHFGSVRANVGF